MPEVKKKVTQTQSDSVNQDGEVVRERTTAMETKGDSKNTLVNVVWYVLGLVSILLGIRFVLRLFGANSANGLVDFVYDVTNVLSSPFRSIFNAETIQAGDTNSVFEPSILVALAVYALIAWGITKLITIQDR